VWARDRRQNITSHIKKNTDFRHYQDKAVKAKQENIGDFRENNDAHKYNKT